MEDILDSELIAEKKPPSPYQQYLVGLIVLEFIFCGWLLYEYKKDLNSYYLQPPQLEFFGPDIPWPNSIYFIATIWFALNLYTIIKRRSPLQWAVKLSIFIFLIFLVEGPFNVIFLLLILLLFLPQIRLGYQLNNRDTRVLPFLSTALAFIWFFVDVFFLFYI